MSMATFWAGGDAFTLRFSFGALCRYEELTDQSLVEGLGAIQKMGENVRFKALVPILQAGLYHSHPAISEAEIMALDVADIKSLIDAIGGAATEAFPNEDEPSGNVRKGKRAA